MPNLSGDYSAPNDLECGKHQRKGERYCEMLDSF